MENLYKAVPAAKRLDTVDKLELKLERDLSTEKIDLSAYAIAKRALVLRRNKEWASLCRAMGWPIEYNELTYDPESFVKVPTEKTVDFDYVGPAIHPDDMDDIQTIKPDIKDIKRRRLHYLIFWLDVLFLSGLYFWLGG